MSDNENTNDTITPFIFFPCTIYCYTITDEGCNSPRDPARLSCDDCCFVSFPCTLIGDFIIIIPRYVKHKCC